jgi:hypothetical protein
MKKVIKILFIVLLTALFLALLLATTVWFQRNQLKQYAIQQLNEQLTAPVSVQTIDISFLDQFPKVSLRFNNVSIQDPIRPKFLFFRAEQVFVAFNVFDILSKNYHVKLIEADSGACNIYINKYGKANYSIFKPSKDDGGDLFLKLSSVRFRNMQVHFLNKESEFELLADTRKAEFSGDFQGNKEALTLTGDFLFQKMVSGTTTLIKSKLVNIDTELHIDETTRMVAFANSQIHVGALELTCSGNIILSQYTLLDISFTAPRMRITDLLELLPGNISNQVADYKSTGSIYFNGGIKGKLSTKQSPSIKVQFGVENGTLTASKRNVSIKQIQCKGEFANGTSGKMADAYLIFPVMGFELSGGHFNGALNIKNFNDPMISLALKGQAPIKDLLTFMHNDYIEQAEGQLKIDIALDGKLKQLSSHAGFLECQTSGSIQCNATDIVLMGGKKTIDQLDAVLQVHQKDLIIETFTAKVNQSDIRVTGAFKNLIPYILSDKQQLEADIDYRSSKLDVENLIFPTTASASSVSPMSLPSNVFVNAQVTIGELVFHDFKARNVKGGIYWKGKRITAEGLTAETFNGKITVNGQVENAANGNFLISSGIQFAQVDMDELFRQCNNFGQSEITSKHIKGKMQGMIELAGVWDAHLNCDLKKLSVLSTLTIKQGELNNYLPLQGLSSYIQVEDLRNLKFADLSNQIEIRKGVITIPEMVVNNNALNLSVSGTHTFGNYLDYHFKIKLSELLAKKFKQRNKEFEEESTDRSANVFISMKGPIDKLEFAYDKKQAKAQVKQDIKKEREEVKKLWRKELGLDKDETIKEQQKETEELEFEAE